ncbi:hypothetical protein OHC33_000173 [Knufia fluminis]|uniref:Glycoside hydrolase family 2 protein n=1 Tax=Knufia fluminis TaxID=191047 RepID=A0AAN8FGS9_9EURO|nr:hypothetical protein OHC33_000173 [Knufia fluminis]
MTEKESGHQYPRPDFERVDPKWRSLDGEWDFAFDDEDVGLREEWCEKWKRIPKEKKRTINVPFVYQTPASGINEQEAHQIVWYQKVLFANTALQFDDTQYRTILRFGAVDYEATVWLNGEFLGSHRGGHVPFEFDVTGKLDEREPTTLTVRVWDAATDLTQPRGKQYWAAKPEGIFYTPSTGIWQSVWLEDVPIVRIADSSHGTILRSNDIESGVLHAEIAVLARRKSQRCSVTIGASLAGETVAKSETTKIDPEKETARLTLGLRLTAEQQEQLPSSFKEAHALTDQSCWRDGLALWSPEHPLLYELVITLVSDETGEVLDEVKTSTGMRSLDWTSGDGTFRLNGRPYFSALVLDQGYWPATNMTPPNANSCKEDIILSKKMGFNGCRKHQKVEDPLFLYWADKLGYLVWGEMANGYEFSNQYVERFNQEWTEAVKRDINHPCIVTWTPVNETWGYTALKSSPTEQNHIRSLYYTTKTLDSTRPINDNCGWEHVTTDLTTFHDYSDGPELARVCHTLEGILKPKANRDMFVGGTAHREGAPVMCTEFGGVNIAVRQGEKSVEGEWGYTTASDAKDLLARVRRLMLGVVEGGHCSGFVYTQLTDIEQETNGLYTYDRKEKLPASDVKDIIDEAQRIYFGKIAARNDVKEL